MSPNPTVKQKVCLVVIDGWGISPEKNTKGDAIEGADTPVMSGFEKTYPYTELFAHGTAVGLPEGLMGNSEVGHLNIGAGRVVYQDIVRINKTLSEGKFGEVPNIKASFDRASSGNGRLHLLGLVSDGGVHSHIKHLKGLLKAAKAAKVPETYVHFFGDGRDTSPKSAAGYYEDLEAYIRELGYGTISTVCGRYYAMDRDKRWERIKLAVDGLTKEDGRTEESDGVKAIKERYERDETDEFLKPILVNKKGLLSDGDTLLCFNFRSDRMREIVQTLGLSPPPMEDVHIPKDLHITTFTRYKTDFPFDIAFPPQAMHDVLAETLSKQGAKQCHVAETEKYAHVTFFFNGGQEVQFKNEERDLISSPKVATYDLQPEMSSEAVGVKVAEEVASGKYDFVMCNFAPPDMVGHTGVYDAAVKGVSATDKAIGIIYEACKKNNYILFVTSDHGNAEKMIGDDGHPHTAHTTAKVPFVMTSTTHSFIPKAEGALCDVAPTLLKVMGLEVPAAMDGRSLLKD
ncbi:MAG: 2,3-bisphosphoglycerate-independent phosphoglycerate mutase [Piptocephalis tieghemiana]|nr:MAG: 2,3-bisphosphoglycerate-independent phosphoglycerate mutase [Piptocephalis tieghemiana]